MFCLEEGREVRIAVGENESPAVKIAAENLRRDLEKVLGSEVLLGADAVCASIRVGTVGASPEMLSGVGVDGLRGEDGTFRREAYIQTVRGGVLTVGGTDRRGTIYGIYEFCEYIGVSPWYDWADVPVRRKRRIELPEGYEKTDYPSVEYRGIFLNDEEELEKWAQLHMGEDTIGVRTYEKIFELILRLKGNYIWPAMHVNSFNRKKENGALADKMGVVVGTSHCDMLMRSNHREWFPWIAEKGYTDAKYDYSIEGRNREILDEYWRESIQQNREFEVSYTLGMRGIHDSGFVTSMLQGGTEEETRNLKIQLLETILARQEEILAEELETPPLRLFIPYKEVLALYDHGLKVPEDMTMVWANDNYGYVRRYPSEAERGRPGGHGIYYHNSYWSARGRSYLFLCSTPLAHTKHELMKAYQEGIRKLWILNVGALKPLEMETEFFLQLAWEAGREEGETQDVDAYVAGWADRNFTGGRGAELGVLWNTFSQTANVRKLEMMEDDVFSQTAYGDEGAVRLHKLRRCLDGVDEIYAGLPEEEKAAFFQTVLLRFHAVYLTMAQYYFSDRSVLCCRQGKMQAAGLYVREMREYEDARRKLLVYYNRKLCAGKWDGIVTPEDFPPPRTAMYPAAMPPLRIGARKMLVHLWHEGERLVLTESREKWFEVSNGGEGSFAVRITAPEWLELSETRAHVETEKRILVRLRDGSAPKAGVICVRNETDGDVLEIPVECLPSPAEDGGDDCSCEDDGAVAISMDGALADGFRSIPRLGREEGTLLEGVREGARISFPVYFRSEGEFLLEIHRFPSLNSVGRIRMGVSVDGGAALTAESTANDEWRGTWVSGITDNVDRVHVRLPYLERGRHVLTLHVIDRYFALSRMVVYTREKKYNNLGLVQGRQELPETGRVREWADAFYGGITLKPRQELVGADFNHGDAMRHTDRAVYPERYGATKSPDEILERASGVFAEEKGAVRIDAVTAYRNTPFAYAENGDWQYCCSESHGRSGLAMYIRETGRKWERIGEAPRLNYRISCTGGAYTLWVLTRIVPWDDSVMGVSVDGVFLGPERLYNRGKLWRYEAEQPWRWVPLAKPDLREGEHLLAVAAAVTGIRIDRIYLTKEEGPPPMDCDWEA